MAGFRYIPLGVLLLLFLVGCQTTGQAYLDANDNVLFDVERSVSGSDVTLDITENLPVSDSLVIIVEKLPSGSEFSTLSPEPTLINDENNVAMWLLSPGAQSLSQFQITGGIPSSITYTVSVGTLSCSDIDGKFGIDDGNGPPFEDYVACPGAASTTTTSSGSSGAAGNISQLLAAFTQYKNDGNISALLSAFNAYKGI